MALQQACYVENGKAVGGVVPDASSAIGYKENVGGTCANPNGYTAGSYFMASNNGYMYEALTNIAHGAAFQIGTNCKQTNVSTELNEINQHLTELESEVPKMANPSLDFANPLHTFDNSHLTFTAIKECYLLGSMNGNASASYGWDAKVNINSIPVYQLTGNGSTSGASSSLTVPLTKINVGDIVTITISNTQTASVNLHIFDVIS